MPPSAWAGDEQAVQHRVSRETLDREAGQPGKFAGYLSAVGCHNSIVGAALHDDAHGFPAKMPW